MTTDHLENSADSPPIAVYGSLERRTIASYERELTKIREALVRKEALAREKDRLIRKLLAGRESAANYVAGLTPRQRQIMDLVLAGHPSKNIAADLGISQRTVEKHRASIMKKTGAKRVPDLARLAFAAVWNTAPDLSPRLELS